MKFLPNEQIERLEVRLVAKGYTKTYGVDYFEVLSDNSSVLCSDYFYQLWWWSNDFCIS